MKKYVALLIYLLTVPSLYAQGRLGVQVAPTISFNRIHTEPVSDSFTSQGATMRFRLGAIYDYPFQDNYNLSTGLLYSTHQFSINNGALSQKFEEAHEVHYLQMPLCLKFYTSEITLDTRIYVQLGLAGRIKLNTRNTELKNRTTLFVADFCRWGLAGLVGAGVEYDASFSTSVFAGISYHPGFVNVISKKSQNASFSRVLGYADLISIDVGARF